MGIIGIEWTECSVKDFHEGEHNGLRFSAANVELGRTVEERSGPDNDNWMTRSETLFRGVVLRCKLRAWTLLSTSSFRSGRAAI